MAVAQTGAIFKALTVDGESSRDYGVYITGQAVYNAPQREVEMISIAGRNGKFALDKGRFENIEVTYPAGIYAETEEDFAEAVSNFRNFLCSRDGYVRIEDEYNPNEYRMGVYKSGLEVTPKLLKAGEFEITFDCKPQRWLKSGETAVTVASGDVISNPTLFESSPMLEVTGEGSIGIGDQTISVEAEQLGKVQLSERVTGETVTLDTTNLLTGDLIFTEPDQAPNVTVTFQLDPLEIFRIRDVEITSGDIFWEYVKQTPTGKHVRIHFEFNSVSFVYGTASSISGSALVKSASFSNDIAVTITLSYDGSNRIDLGCTFANVPANVETTVFRNHYPYYGNSTKISTPEPMYIDLDIGEAYGEVGGQIVSLNDSVELPSDLPKLSSGANTITYSGDITDLKIIPRWWKV